MVIMPPCSNAINCISFKDIRFSCKSHIQFDSNTKLCENQERGRHIYTVSDELSTIIYNPLNLVYQIKRNIDKPKPFFLPANLRAQFMN